MTLQEERVKLEAVKADIRQAEKKREDLLRDIEELQKTKENAFKQYLTESKKRDDALDARREELVELRVWCHMYSKSVETFQEYIKDFGKKEVEEANQRLLVVHSDIDIIRREISDREKNIDDRLEMLQRREDAVKRGLQSIALQQGAVEDNHKAVEKERDMLRDKKRDIGTAVAEAAKKLDDITMLLIQKRREMESIDRDIHIKTVNAKGIGSDAAAQLQEAERRMREVDARERDLNAKEQNIITKTIWLDDREAELRRTARGISSGRVKVN